MPPARDPARVALDRAASPYLDRADVAAYMRVAPATIDQMRAKGRFPRPYRIGSRPLWLASDIDAWIRAGSPPADEWEALRDAAQVPT